MCSLCKMIPNSHSFHKIAETTILYYYTCPAQAIFYDDVKSIMDHYVSVLNDMPKKEWVWIFDSTGFTFVHAMQVNVAIEIAKLITQFSTHLKKIIVIHPTMYVTLTHTLVLPFLNSKIKDIIEIDYTSTVEQLIL